ncbi:MAG: excinuclease subunit [Candidatus Atribacteria bacterium]|nr:excinuclease subunit [Candidatus Atribacteria bacterium]
MKKKEYARLEVKKDNLEELPSTCGVYLFQDESGETIYVGKAVNIKNRVRSHFHNYPLSPLKQEMKERVSQVSYILTEDENEALLLEEELIKSAQPRYNLRLKDDKSYPYLRIDSSGSFPAIRLSRKKIAREGRFFGPFTDVKGARQGLKTLRSVFLLRSCRVAESRFPLARPCLDFQLGLCSAPCAGLISPEDYQKNVNQAISFLNGDYQLVSAWLEEEMKKAARNLNFELAASYRDRLRAVKKLLARYRLVLPEPQDIDFLEAKVEVNIAAIALLKVRKGRLIGCENLFVSGENLEKEQVIRQFIDEFYLDYFSLPSRVCLSIKAVAQKEIVEEVGGRSCIFSGPKSQAEQELLEFTLENCRKNLELRSSRLKKREMEIETKLKEMQSLFNLPALPRRISGVDISNFQGGEAVGSVVSFWNGLPDKTHYRKFIIKRTDYPNDYQMMAEVLERYLGKVRTGDFVFPDLILVDGGKGQLSTAQKARDLLALKIPIISLAKEFEEIYLEGHPDPIRLPENSSVLQLLQRIRNEAHRFAVSFHRKRRNDRAFHSVLDGVKGIGPKRRQKLMIALDNLEDILKQDSVELSKNLQIPRPIIDDLKEKVANLEKGHGV